MISACSEYRVPFLLFSNISNRPFEYTKYSKLFQYWRLPRDYFYIVEINLCLKNSIYINLEIVSMDFITHGFFVNR